ncbi:MAG TPA: CotH kinase family protein [Methanocella sp.]|nr:CotH kinase family protein [Methanocella sp.]
MQIKSDADTSFTTLFSNAKNSAYKMLTGKKVTFLVLIIVFLIGSSAGLIITGFFGTADSPSGLAKNVYNFLLSAGLGKTTSDAFQMLKYIMHENVAVPGEQISQLTSSPPEQMTINIKFKDFEKIEDKRNEALAVGMLISTPDDYVPATIQYKNQTLDAELRLKGNWPDHWSGNRWSYRIKLKGNETLFGYNEFSIEDPSTRVNINEWVFMKALQRENVSTVDYSFVGVTINGEDKGVYMMEEGMDDKLVENNGLESGPIIRYNDTLVYGELALLRKDDISLAKGFSADKAFYAPVSAPNMNSLSKDNASYNEFLEGKDLLEEYRNDQLQTSQVFDVDKLAKFEAMSVLINNVNGLFLGNRIFYYNPITSKLEPISADTENEFTSTSIFPDKDLYPYDDPVFFRSYAHELEIMSDPAYVDGLFRDIGPEMQQNITYIRKNNPSYYYTQDEIRQNQAFIRAKLNPVFALNAYYTGENPDGNITLEIGNVQEMPLEILNLTYADGTVFVPENGSFILNTRKQLTPVSYEKESFIVPKGFNWSDQNIKNMTMYYRLLGTTPIRNASIMPYSYPDSNISSDDLSTQTPNVDQFDFLIVNNTTGTIQVKPGDWQVNRSIVIPAGYMVNCNMGTGLDMVNSSRIISYSPVELLGTDDEPIIINSSDGTGQGIAVMNAEKNSTLEDVIFSGISTPSHDRWNLDSQVTFYNSSVDMNQIIFKNNTGGEHLLGMYQSNFTIYSTLFMDPPKDGCQISHSVGSIYYSSFIDSGRDGVNLTGSSVYISNPIFNGTKGTCILADKNSAANIGSIEFTNSFAGVCSKDASAVLVDDSIGTSSSYGYIACRGDPYSAPSSIKVTGSSVRGVNMSYVVEDGSSLSVNSIKIPTTKGTDLADYLTSQAG